jgi:hypothetical protein
MCIYRAPYADAPELILLCVRHLSLLVRQVSCVAKGLNTINVGVKDESDVCGQRSRLERGANVLHIHIYTARAGAT